MAKKKPTDQELTDIMNGSAPEGDGSGAPVALADPHEGNGQQPPKESKADRWKRLANRRVPRLLKAIRHVANLANRSQYEYTPEQVATLFGKLDAELSALQVAYHKADAAKSVAETQLF